jgi:hypothetical protein
MIVAEADGTVQFVTQPAHAALAGQFADRWGGAVEAPSPRAPAVHAAYAHDDGWLAYDRVPHLHDDGQVVDFRSVPDDVWVDLYGEGVDAVAAADARAGLLCSLHGAGLRRRRYGLSPSWPDTPPAFEAYVAREEDRQARLAEDLRAAGRLDGADLDLIDALHESGRPPAPPGSRLWRNYQRLQVWDALSLFFCTSVTPDTTDLEGVPAGPNTETTVRVERDGPGEGGEEAYRFEPYPFEAAPLRVTVPVRTVTDDFDSEADLRRRYYESPREEKAFTLWPA